MGRAAALEQLCSILRDEPNSVQDWTEILELANKGLITPRLEACLEPALAPAEVKRFVAAVSERNRRRNTLLYQQLQSAAAALNRVGLVPLVIKGGACLVRWGGAYPRMISDIDLVVDPARIDDAVEALVLAGFEVMARYELIRLHGAAVLGRAKDPGQIDLHRRPPGPPSFVCDPALLQRTALRSIGAAEVRIPEPHLHIFLQALHDQLHDGGYWRGGFDLRHAWDIADLISAKAGVDWDALAALAPTRLTTRVIGAQLLACRQLTGAEIPARFDRWPTRLHVGRQRLQFIWPSLRIPLAALALMSEVGDLLAHRAAAHAGRSDQGIPPQVGDTLKSFAQLRRLMARHVGGRL